MHAEPTTPLTVAERLRILASQAARPLTVGDDPQETLNRLARQLAALASELEHATYAARPAGATPAVDGTDRLWRTDL